MERREARTAALDPEGRWLSPFGCFVLGSSFAVLDALTTWYALRFTHIPEGNPVLRWAFGEFGVTPALVLRVLVGCTALAVLAWGVRARLPRHARVFNAGCQLLLSGALVIWGTVAFSNLLQILYVDMRWG
ncbi:MAG TPA: DUF5658 family protein [Acidimicrobiia bacterium]|nr:DUF5658 family protein [Acidimicrobiia bacterium]